MVNSDGSKLNEPTSIDLTSFEVWVQRPKRSEQVQETKNQPIKGRQIVL